MPGSINKPFFLITIDTEGDDLWSRPKNISTKNANFIPRFQNLCESYGFKPTYLTNYEMACSDVFKELGIDIISKNTGEIGMHLHAWNNPPIKPLTKNDSYYQPYLIEYPENIINEKIKVITDLLEDTFNKKMISHRAGRWAFNDVYAKLLFDHGYKIDCSVTPLRSWENTLGDPKGCGGSDYIFYPDMPYWVGKNIVEKDHAILEIPVTIMSRYNIINNLLNSPFFMRKAIISIIKKRISPIWFRPNGNNLDKMKNIIKYKIKHNADYIMLVLHSSELMPSGSPTFKNEKDIENLFSHLNVIFSYSQDLFQAGTLSDYYSYYINK